MPSYRFKFYDPNSRSEKLGAAVLADDDEAVAFAQRVIRELIHGEQLYAECMVKITAKEREVASMPFASNAASRPCRQKGCYRRPNFSTVARSGTPKEAIPARATTPKR
jgi:hypothetical protein